MALQAFSSSSSINYGWTFDVFLSFRGTDTRHGFTGNLYNALCNRGIRTFIDDEELRKGEEITPSLVKAIQESRIAIIVFSKNYASSCFCLDELTIIMECVKGKGRLILPIFFNVNPCDVRHQKGTYGEALARHEERFKHKVQKWREALHQVANLSGEDLKLGSEYEYVFIGKIVKEISNKINRVPLHVANYPVGLESRVLKVNKILNDGSNGGVHVLGIYGVGGIGKTTLARAIYNLIADQFESLCFLENVRENSTKHGLAHLQETLLSKMLGEEDIKLASVGEGISIIKHRFQSKMILLVLDDVDKLEQLQAIAGSPDWFSSGSRVIITTRDKHLLATHGVKRQYEVKDLNNEEAFELLHWNAFKFEKVDRSYISILKKVMSYASGLPLALVIIGSNLHGRSVDEWISALDEYKKIPNKDILKILKVSFDALEEYQQKFFLDIACCFKGYKLEDIEAILHAHHDVSPKSGICVLVERSLIKINMHGVVTLHDLIQDMGKEIVRKKSPQSPGKRSRLWFPEDIVQVLKENTGSNQIEILLLDNPISKVVEWDGKAFKKMRNLRTLIIRGADFTQGAKYLPNSLRVLEWWNYPSNSLPSDFNPRNLAIFKLPHNNLMSVGFLEKRKFMNLAILQLDFSNIKKIPDISGIPNLVELSFNCCQNLTEVHESVGFLDKLRFLNAWKCKKLSSFPPLMLPSLEKLNLSWCSSLESFPEILGKMKFVTEIRLEGTPMNELSSSILNFVGLNFFYLSGVKMLDQFPSISLRNPDGLDFLTFERVPFPRLEKGEEEGSSMVSSNAKRVLFKYCSLSDDSIPIVLAWFRNAKYLNLSGNNFTVLPESIKELCSLRSLILDECKELLEIRRIPPNIKCFYARNCISLTSSSRSMLLDKELHRDGDTWFHLPGSSIPEWFELCSKQDSISFWIRHKLPALSLCVVVGPAGYVGRKHDGYLYDVGLELFINGERDSSFDYRFRTPHLTVDHIVIIDMKSIKSLYKVNNVLPENKWNHVVCRGKSDDARSSVIEKFGIHVLKHKSNMEDIRFSDPLFHDEEEVNVGDFQRNMQQQENVASSAILETQQEKWLSLHLPPAMNSLNGSKTSATIQKTATMQVAESKRGKHPNASNKGVPTISSKNHDKDSDVEVVEITTVPTAISGPSPIENKGKQIVSCVHSENADQPVIALMEIPLPSAQPLDPLAELERVILGSYDLSPESTFPTAASCSEIQNSEIVIILQNLEPLLDNPLESLIADGEIKRQIRDCLSKLGQFEDHIPISLQHIIAQVREFYEDLISDFPSIQLTLVDYSCLEETRSIFLEDLKQAKIKQARIDAEVSGEKNQLEELDAEIAKLELRLKAAVGKRSELQLAIKNGEADKNTAMEDASTWLLESKQVIEKMRRSEHAYMEAQSSKEKLEGRRATLKEAFAANKP